LDGRQYKKYIPRKSKMYHIPIAILIQLLIAPVFGWWVGAAAGAFYFIGREYAQAEYRLIEHHYGGKRANMPTLAPLREARAWNTKATLDWLLPTIAAILVAIVLTKLI
jgi:hypothetical protein